MLAYTLDLILSLQRAQIERDEAPLDEFGGEVKAERKVIATVPCRFWWWREGSARTTSKEYATPQRTINFAGGGITVKLGTDVQDGDHIANILDREGEVLIEGPFRVVATEIWEDHLEAALMRP